jgi:hypothetical protein
LNFHDLAVVGGLLPDEALESGYVGERLGMDFAGIVTAVGVGTDYARADHSHGSPALGTSASTACAGNDSRLADSRAPTGAASGDLASHCAHCLD